MRLFVSGVGLRVAGAVSLAMLTNPASAEKVDPDAYPALAADVILPPGIPDRCLNHRNEGSLLDADHPR